jgi:hypothetical protein
MKDSELRGLILQKYYEKRREQWSQWKTEDFSDLPDTIEFDAVDLYRACDQLAEYGLIDWKPLRGHKNQTVGGVGKISAAGVDVVEGNSRPPISIVLDQSHHIAVHHSSNVQVGHGNVQDVTVQVEKIIGAIDKSSASEEEKKEAKSLLKKFLEHPLVSSIAGGLASSLKL